MQEVRGGKHRFVGEGDFDAHLLAVGAMLRLYAGLVLPAKGEDVRLDDFQGLCGGLRKYCHVHAAKLLHHLHALLLVEYWTTRPFIDMAILGDRHDKLTA